MEMSCGSRCLTAEMGIERNTRSGFRPFYRIDEDRNSRHGGNGIGISIVSSVVEQMRGRIQVESRPGEGSEFKIELPLNGGTLGG